MTKEEIIKMARQSGAIFDHITWVERDLFPVFERFAKLVAEKEREACAKIADKSHRIFRDTKDAHDRNSPNLEPFNPNAFGFSNYAIEESLKITLAIRARGQE
jgi:hypothetical protein